MVGGRQSLEGKVGDFSEIQGKGKLSRQSELYMQRHEYGKPLSTFRDLPLLHQRRRRKIGDKPETQTGTR